MNIPNAGPTGLKSQATVAASSYGACLGAGITTSGRLAIATDSNYQALSNTPLSNRTLWFDRKLSSSSTWTNNVTSATATNASGNNWSKSFSSGSTTPVTYNFRVHDDGELAVDGSRSINWPSPVTTETIFSITSSSPC